MGNKVTFHPETRIIQIDQAPVDGIVEIDVKIDLYSDGKEDWITDPDLTQMVFPITGIGGQPVSEYENMGSTFFLDSSWKIRPYEGDHVCKINGNLYSVDNTSIFTDTVGSWQIRTEQKVSVLVSSSFSQQSELQFMAFGDGPTIDVVNGVAGTTYNIGTKENPSNNLGDAILIDNGRWKKFNIVESMTLDSGTDLSNYCIEGRSHSNVKLTLDPSLTCPNLILKNADIEGTLDGGTLLRNCRVGDVNYMNGCFHNCFHYGTIVLAGGSDALLDQCGQLDPDLEVIIDMGGSGQNVILANWKGNITFKNLSGGNMIDIQMDGGTVTLDSTISGLGIICLSGNGCLIDNSSSYYLMQNELVNASLIKELRRGNLAYEFVEAVAEVPLRKVAMGKLDYMITKTKSDDVVDWSNPTSTKTLYAWYKTLGDDNPQFMKGET